MEYFDLREDAELIEIARRGPPGDLAFELANRLEQALTMEEQLEEVGAELGSAEDRLTTANEEIDGLKDEVSTLEAELVELEELLSQQREKENVAA